MVIYEKERREIKMIGIWNYTVILTYVSLASSFVGMVMALNGRIMPALLCLAFSGLCDAFDGRVARSKKDRTDSEKLFGIQLDSLCDVVCFGFLPVVICYQMGVTSKVGMGLMIFYCIAAVARLAYFNMLELEKNDGECPKSSGYRGLPVTSIAVIFPVLYFANYWIPFEFKPLVWELMMLITGGLFVANIRIQKPTLLHILVLTIIVSGLFVTMPFLKMTV